MIHANPGNLLKFSVFADFQRHKQAGQDRVPFGILATTTRLVPFQIFVNAGVSAATWRLVDPADETGATEIAMDAGDLTIESAPEGAWVTFYGTSDLTTEAVCGYWYVEVDIDGQLYHSEVLQVFEPTVVAFAQTDWKMRFGNPGQDKGTVLYQNSYTNIFYLRRWAWDRPVTDRDVEIVVDGNGNEVHRFTRTVARFKLEVSDIPDYCLPFFAKCGDLSYTVMDGGEDGAEIEMANISFESRPQGVGLNIGVFTFDAEVESFNGCQSNYTLE